MHLGPQKDFERIQFESPMLLAIDYLQNWAKKAAEVKLDARQESERIAGDARLLSPRAPICFNRIATFKKPDGHPGKDCPPGQRLQV